jgi:hypothetical protein
LAIAPIPSVGASCTTAIIVVSLGPPADIETTWPSNACPRICPADDAPEVSFWEIAHAASSVSQIPGNGHGNHRQLVTRIIKAGCRL